MKIKYPKIFIIIIFFIIGGFVNAENVSEYTSFKKEIKVKNSKNTINVNFDNYFKIDFIKDSLKEEIIAEFMILDDKEVSLPWKLKKLSPIYQMDLKPGSSYNNTKPLYLEIKYNESSSFFKRVYFYNKQKRIWHPLPSWDNHLEKTVKAIIHLPFAKLAVFADPDIMTIGQASWYKHKKGDFAASPDFPLGARLRVKNLANNEFVDVTVNDYGPNRKKHPERVIDLEKTAFQKIAKREDGIIKVAIEPLPSKNGKVLGISETAQFSDLKLNAKAALLTNETTGEIIYIKNGEDKLSLASLSKIMAIAVFLNFKNNLDEIVTYNIKDEELNHSYVNYAWQSVKLKIKDGETLTVKDLIYASLIGSANNAIESLVRISGLTRNEFIKKMNDQAILWGAYNTVFVEPTGLSPENKSSVFDYAIIVKEAMKNQIIVDASSVSEYIFSTINTKKKHIIKNTNPLVRNSNFYITGSKTGYLEEAGYCLMTRIKVSNGHYLIAINFGNNSKIESVNENKALIQYGLSKIND